MVIHAFPIAKLGALLLRQVSKPIANSVKQQAMDSPVFRKYICLPPAQFYNWCEVKVKMWLLQLGQPVNIQVLNEAASMELGANMLGEGIIFLIAAGIVVAEYTRSSRKETAKEEARKAEMQMLQDNVRDLFIQTEQQSAQIRELIRKLGEIDTSSKTKPQIKQEPAREPPSKEPPPLVGRSSVREEKQFVRNVDEVDLLQLSTRRPVHGILFQALSDVENSFFFDKNKKRDPGVLIAGLNLLYKDVYKTSLTF